MVSENQSNIFLAFLKAGILLNNFFTVKPYQMLCPTLPIFINWYFILAYFYRREQDPETIYLKHVEHSAQQQQKLEQVETRYGVPSFTTPLNDLTIMEGEKAHLDAKVAPVGDPSIKVEWYCNGQTISASE